MKSWKYDPNLLVKKQRRNWLERKNSAKWNEKVVNCGLPDPQKFAA